MGIAARWDVGAIGSKPLSTAVPGRIINLALVLTFNF